MKYQVYTNVWKNMSKNKEDTVNLQFKTSRETTIQIDQFSDNKKTRISPFVLHALVNVERVLS